MIILVYRDFQMKILIVRKKIKDICDDIPLENLFWHYKSTSKDIAMSYICFTIIDIFSLIGALLFFGIMILEELNII